MKFKNIATKKENIKYIPGDVLIGYNVRLLEERAYMVTRKYGMYNLIDLNEGQVYFSDNRHYDDFSSKVGQLFASVEIIGNRELELVRVED